MKVKKKRNNLSNCKELKKSTRGITLIALVITIIVLLILAGVSIATLTGENGILTRAQEAKNKTEQAEKDEKEELGDMEDILNEYVSGLEVEQVTDENPGVLEGTGTDTDPYIINSIEDLVVFASNVTNGTTYEGQTVKLGLSLDFNSNKSYVDPLRTDYGQYGYNGELKTLLTTGSGFIPIGSVTGDQSKSFLGIFDGYGNSIDNIYIMRKCDSVNQEIVGGMFNDNYGNIKNLQINNGKIEVIGNGNTYLLVGGIVGRNWGEIFRCSYSGSLNSNGNITAQSLLGGIVGQNQSTIEECYNGASVYINDTNLSNEIFIGGIAGQNRKGKIGNCYNLGNITGKSEKILYIGGITAYNHQKIYNSYNIGEIEGEGVTELNIGGISGVNSYIENCYNLGKIYGIENSVANIGGIVGNQLAGNEETAIINNCSNIGQIVISDNANIGEIVGKNSWTTLNNCYYNFQNGIDAIGENTGGTLNNVIQTDNMPTVLSIIGSKFKEDIDNINNDYPVLIWQ